MEWLKKHWGILAAIAVGIPVVYFLYQTYQSNQANAGSQADPTLQDQTEADQAAYAQEIALGNLSGGIGSSGGGSNAVSPISAPIQTQQTSTASSPVTTSTSGAQFSADNPGAVHVAGTQPGDPPPYEFTGGGAAIEAMGEAAGVVSQADLNAFNSSTISQPANVGVTTPAKAALFGTGDTGVQTPVVASTPVTGRGAPIGLAQHAASSGEIPQHNTLEPHLSLVGS